MSGADKVSDLTAAIVINYCQMYTAALAICLTLQASQIYIHHI